MRAARVADRNVTLNADTTVGSVIVPQNSAQDSCADFRTSAPSGIITSSDRYVSVYPSVSGKPGMMREDGRAIQVLPGRRQSGEGSGGMRQSQAPWYGYGDECHPDGATATEGPRSQTPFDSEVPRRKLLG